MYHIPLLPNSYEFLQGVLGKNNDLTRLGFIPLNSLISTLDWYLNPLKAFYLLHIISKLGTSICKGFKKKYIYVCGTNPKISVFVAQFRGTRR